MKSAQTGFTLIELSIVLVIIGLLVGSVLVGRDLIRAAEVRAQVKQIEQIELAVATFKGKYKCIPGDCDHATDFWSDAVNGDGDRLIVTATENADLWHQLSQAKLVAGSYRSSATSTFTIAVDTPAAALKGSGVLLGGGGTASQGGLVIGTSTLATVISSFFGEHANVLVISTAFYPGSDYSGVYSGADSYALDSKFDDGMPLSGRMKSANGSMSVVNEFPVSDGSVKQASCLDDVENAPDTIYNYTQENIDDDPYAAWCSPFIKMSF